MTEEPRSAEGLINLIIRDIAELPYRTSPEDFPESMTVTGDELRAILLSRLPRTTTDTVERAARFIDFAPSFKRTRDGTYWYAEGWVGENRYEFFAAEGSDMEGVAKTLCHRLNTVAAAIRDLPSAAGGEDKLRGALERIAAGEGLPQLIAKCALLPPRSTLNRHKEMRSE